MSDDSSSAWQMFMTNLRRTDNGALVRTSCMLPSGSLLSVSVQPAIDGWIVCDEGAVVADAMAHGFDVDFSLKGLASRLSREGLKVEKGRIYSEKVGSGELPFMVAYLATSAIEASKWLVNNAAKHSRRAMMQLGYDGEKHDDCPFCGEPWASQSHYDLQSCNCIHQTDDADAYAVLVAVADCARRWVPEARIIGNVRAADILKACNEATSLIARNRSKHVPSKEPPK